jgi:DNA topoisomerase I
VITEAFGESYVKTRKYSTRTKGAQEAHEAIRPTYADNRQIEGDNSSKRLYDLIWKRTIASQMSDARLEKTNVTIGISNSPEKFIAQGEVIKFDGFLKVYMESRDDDENEDHEGILPPLAKGDVMNPGSVYAQQKFTQHLPRYTEASLVKKLEDLGIGRPSTYAPTISTIQKREYVIREDRPGVTRKYDLIVLRDGKITEKEETENTGYEKAKLFPTDIGVLVTSFLIQYFDNVLDYNFTATVEEEFDEIAQGKLVWNKMIGEFYGPFHARIEKTLETSKKVSGEKLLGLDPKTGENVFVKIGRFGPMVQIGNSESEVKPRFAGLKKGQSIESITLEEALELFKLPRTLGTYESEEVIAATGRFGPFVKHKAGFYSMAKTDDPMTITLERAIILIDEKRKKDSEKLISEFPGKEPVRVLNGRYGAYISYNKDNYRIPKGKDPAELTLEDCMKIISETQPARKSNRNKKK